MATTCNPGVCGVGNSVTFKHMASLHKGNIHGGGDPSVLDANYPPNLLLARGPLGGGGGGGGQSEGGVQGGRMGGGIGGAGGGAPGGSVGGGGPSGAIRGGGGGLRIVLGCKLNKIFLRAPLVFM